MSRTVTILVSDVGSAYFLLRALDQELEISRRTLGSPGGGAATRQGA